MKSHISLCDFAFYVPKHDDRITTSYLLVMLLAGLNKSHFIQADASVES